MPRQVGIPSMLKLWFSGPLDLGVLRAEGQTSQRLFQVHPFHRILGMRQSVGELEKAGLLIRETGTRTPLSLRATAAHRISVLTLRLASAPRSVRGSQAWAGVSLAHGAQDREDDPARSGGRASVEARRS